MFCRAAHAPGRLIGITRIFHNQMTRPGPNAPEDKTRRNGLRTPHTYHIEMKEKQQNYAPRTVIKRRKHAKKYEKGSPEFYQVSITAR